MRELAYSDEQKLVTWDPVLGEAFGEVSEVIAPADLDFLALGPTGSGKDGLARGAYWNGPRRGKSFLTINCGALAETLLESELFGHVKGAFTGATADRAGYFETIHGGTIFLDEVGELSAGAQAKLLRVLDRGEVTRVGASRSTSVDVRVVAATNRDLKAMLQEGTFRDDLYYRLATDVIEVPALKDRPADIEGLATLFLKREACARGVRISGLDAEMAKRFVDYSWPGNVRQLESTLVSAVARHKARRPGDRLLRVEDLPREIRLEWVAAGISVQSASPSKSESTETWNEDLLNALSDHDDMRVRDLADELNLDPRTVRRRLAELETRGLVHIERRAGRGGNLVRRVSTS